ncbi:hypothetical protein K435DRAFT_867374 [Dendrothele bispora CBS 962.96]|uniref:Phospholipase/carboxylesterase/thioesterase domain-containing protein n=1 Tax=Dendrothele bispora (strain CBS 962.96) TaxID=1314807 RepID=A0A4V4HDI5_DENBC|nr:hypothetical protein K435DRAFT_867374 [Dendrothele bispora CBS 962.96]
MQSSTSTPEIHLRTPSSQPSPSPKVKSPPKPTSIPTPFSYYPSDDGTDENLLILLHGLGDTHIPFSKLGKQFKLPQTAVLAIRAPEQYVSLPFSPPQDSTYTISALSFHILNPI